MNFSTDLQNQLLTQLQHILHELQLTLPETTQVKMIHHLALLLTWNKAYNLTAITDPQQMLIKHVADSLAVAAYLPGTRFIDVGTGAGFPGVPLALAMPKTQWTLLDSNGKKIRFLLQLKASLQLDNVDIVHARVEEFLPQQLFDGVVARAWSDLAQMLEKTRHLCVATGKLWALKGASPTQELAQLTLPYTVESIRTPGLPADARHLICVSYGY